MTNDESPRDPLSDEALAEEIEEDARHERRVGWIGVVGVVVTAVVIIVMATLR